MVTHPWYVLRIPYTDIYLPPWTVGILLVLSMLAVAGIVAIVGANLSTSQREKR
jgi:hypothetical protein